MLSKKFIFFVLTAFSISFFAGKTEGADNWGFWNPFSKSKSSSSSSQSSYSSSSKSKSWLPTWKTPTMPWSKPKPRVSSYQKKNNSAWNSMSKTTKKWWNKTTELLDPYPDPKPPVDSSVADANKKKSGWFSWAGWGKSEKKETETMGLPDFLRQKAPD